MRRTILLSLLMFLAVSAATDACAQRRGGARSGFVQAGYGFNRARAVLPHGFGYAYLPYGFDYGYADAPQPVLFVSTTPVPPHRRAVGASCGRSTGASCGHRVQMASSRRGFFALPALGNI